ncbi:MAG: energy transducer TonB [Bacteroidia bacterium]
MYAPNEIDKRSFTDILFENRNKKYGAYLLRRYYYRHVFIGLAFSISILVIGLLLPYLIDMLRPAPPLFEQDRLVDIHVLPPPPGALEMEYVPPVTPPEKNIPPVVTKDTVVEKKRERKKEKPKPDFTSRDTGQSTGEPGGGGNGTGSVDDIYLIVDERPVPPGGSWNDYVSKHLKYPEQEKLMNVQGKVLITCIINKDGTLQDIKVTQGVSPGLNAEAVRLVKSMPAWKPAKRQGQPVRMIIKLPINFSLKR